VCDQFALQPRGSAGEHSAAEGGKFDVSNKQRIGFSEVQLVQKMIDGILRVIELEKMLANGASPEDVMAACGLAPAAEEGEEGGEESDEGLGETSAGDTTADETADESDGNFYNGDTSDDALGYGA
jgi:hypothetical protein